MRGSIKKSIDSQLTADKAASIHKALDDAAAKTSSSSSSSSSFSGVNMVEKTFFDLIDTTRHIDSKVAVLGLTQADMFSVYPSSSSSSSSSSANHHHANGTGSSSFSSSSSTETAAAAAVVDKRGRQMVYCMGDCIVVEEAMSVLGEELRKVTRTKKRKKVTYSISWLLMRRRMDLYHFGLSSSLFPLCPYYLLPRTKQTGND